MKTSTLMTAWLVSALALTTAKAAPANGSANAKSPAVPAPTAFREVAADLNSRVWQNESYEATPDGKIVTHVHQYTELASGLNFLQGGKYVPAQEKIEVFPGGAVARQGQHNVIFANNLNTHGAIDMQTPDGKRLRSNVLGLMYYDTATGDAVLIARLQDSEGQLVADNKVLYRNAFEGVNANVQYTYSRCGLEQDVILNTQPPAPEAYDMPSETTELEVFTEFIEPPAARVREMQVDDNALEADQEVGWGDVQLGRGKAFTLGTQEPQTAVVKRYVTIQGRTFLLEKVAVKDIQSSLSKLPEQASNGKRLPMLASKNPQLPSAPKIHAAAKAMKLALEAMPAQGYVLDYVALTSAVTNQTFQSDTTYYISGTLNTYGTNTFEGGTVIKYATNSILNINGTINCQTAPYRPAVFTAKDDNTVGETISGSTGTPSGYYGTSIAYGYLTVPQQLHDLRISHAVTVLSVGYNVVTNSLQNVQMYHVGYGVSAYYAGNWKFQNLLLSRVGSAVIAASSALISGEHWTVDQASTICSGPTLYLTNSLLSAITNMGAFTSVKNVTNSSGSGVFQTVGGGAYYLVTNSPYRNVGTTNIDPVLLAQLRQKTTYPPIAYTNISFYSPTNYSPRAARDTNAAPDLGYHYDPLDYTFGGCHVYTNITFSAGTAVGWFRTTSGWNHAGQGLHLDDRQVCTFNGTATAPCYWVRLNTVQEHDTTAGYGPGGVTGWADQYAYDVTRSPFLNFNWTKCSMMATEAGAYFRDDYGYLTVRGNACEFGAGNAGGYIVSLFFTNCLFDRTYLANVAGWTGNAVAVINCTIHGGMLQMVTYSTPIPVRVQNCALDGTVVDMENYAANSSYATYGYNAYTNATNPFPFGSNNVVVTNFNWQKSWFGNYYLPTNSPLIDKGSTTADLVGLYHFTTQANQVKETNSIVDIGYHYVATDTYGNPLDVNGDGIVDYQSDANGNGLVDNGETNWAVGIILQPAGQTVVQGSNAVFNVTAAGMPLLKYQWWFNGTNLLPTGTNASLVLTNVQLTNAGTYSVVVTNMLGGVTSSIAALTVLALTDDWDYDGRNNGQEISDGTDLFNPNSVLPVRLGYWRFDNTNTWIGDAGQLPLQVSNLTAVASWDTNAVGFNQTNALLKYRDVETNGNANINLRNGSVSLWFKPDWSSANAGGVGPQNAGRLIEMGTKGATNGWWGLVFNPAGTNLYFGTQTNATNTLTTNLTAALNWTSNQWHQVVLTYSPTNSALYLDGQLATNGTSSLYYPNATERANGFRLGSDQTGTNQAKGTFENVATYNYPLSATEVSSNYQADVHQDRNGNGLADLWEWQNFGTNGVNPAADSDGDGLSNLGEYQNGTNPHQFDAVRLGYWRFNDVPNWQDESGLNPNVAQGLYPIPSWSGDAVRIHSTQNGTLGYPQLRTNGSAVVASQAGSLRFWFKPDWNSSTPEQDQGPGDVVRLFEMGRQTADASYGWVALTINSLGTKLNFSTEANGVHTDNASYPISFSAKNWYQIVLTYTPSNSLIYVNGQGLATNGLGWPGQLGTNVMAQGFYLGSSWDGVHQANGEFEELETFNYPLSATNIATNYQAIALVDTDADGLTDVVENGLGSRPDAVDSDCDGLPDAWEVAHGLNPNDPTDATEAMMAFYVQGSPLATTNALGAVQTNLINVYFSSFASNVNHSVIYGAAVTSSVSNDVWNFCDQNADYTKSGISLVDSSGQATGARLFAFIGPCSSPVATLPAADDWDWNEAALVVITNSISYSTNLTYNSYTTNVDFVLPFRLGYVPWNWWCSPVEQFAIHQVRDWFEENYLIKCSECGVAKPISDYLFDVYIHDFYTGLQPWLSSWFINHPDMNPANLYLGPDGRSVYYGLHINVRQDISTAVEQISAYQSSLTNYYISSYPATNPPAFIVNSFIPAFVAIDNYGYSLVGNRGALWNYSGSTNAQTGTGWTFPGSTNALSGTFIKKMFPEAKRTLLVNGLAAGNYDVFIYYAGSTSYLPAVLNDHVATKISSPTGPNFWYANVDTVFMPVPTSYDQVISAAVTPWALTNHNNYCLKMDIDWPDVTDPTLDTKVIGLQLVRHTEAFTTGDSLTNVVLQVKPGNQTAYLQWQEPVAAVSNNIYWGNTATNVTNWLATTTQKQYQDTNNLQVGTTYYYKVVGVKPGDTNDVVSEVIGVVPFGCASPLPPRIDYVNELQIPVDNGAFPITWQMLMTNSDALDPQGYPLVFKVASVNSGSLMINGSPFSAGNNTISPNDAVIWTPSSVMAAPGTPAFQVFVHDGLNRSVKTVKVLIKQHPKTYLMAWGVNSVSGMLNAGDLGTGEADTPYSALVDTDGHGWQYMPNNFDNYPAFRYQNYFGIYPFDSRWHINFNNTTWGLLTRPPQRVLDLNTADAISCFSDTGLGHCAVTADKHLWFWGEAYSYALGMPYVVGYDRATTNYYTQFPAGPKVWGREPLDTSLYWYPLDLTVLSPVPVLDAKTGRPITGVAAAKNCFILKADGSLWSFGQGGDMLGRKPELATVVFSAGVTIGMVPGQVELAGYNDQHGISPGYEIVEINTSGSPREGGMAALARCKNGSLWAWGCLEDEYIPKSGGLFGEGRVYQLQLAGTTPSDQMWQPRRLTQVEAASSSPIKRVSEALNHIVIWREDGSLSEIGFIPGQAPDVMTAADCFTGIYDLIYHCGADNYDFDHVYSASPVVVSNVPPNIRQLSVAPTFATVLTDAGEVWVWGQWLGQSLPAPQKITSLSGIVKIAAGYQYILALDKKGRLWGVGINSDGVFGFNDNKFDYVAYGLLNFVYWLPVDMGVVHTNAVRVAGIENVVDVFTGDEAWASQAYAIGTDVQGKPVGLTATPTNQAVKLAWDSYPAALSYNVYRSLNEDAGYVLIGNSPVNAFTDQSAPLQNGQTYYYQVSAIVNGVETTPSWDVAATPFPPPTAVLGLTNYRACHGIKLQWSAPTNAAASPLEEYVVLADGLQLAELLPSATNYYDSRELIPTPCTYTVTARNSAGQSSASCQLTTNSPVIGCDPAPYVGTNNGAYGSSSTWLAVAAAPDGGGGSDQATLVWGGATTNGSWLFQKSEFDRYVGTPPAGNYSGIPATETVSGLITDLVNADTNNTPVKAWLWSQFSSSETNLLSAGLDFPSVTEIINTLQLADTNTSVLQAWLWSQFHTNETSIFLDASRSEPDEKTNLLQALARIVADQPADSNQVFYSYANLLYAQINNPTAALTAGELNDKLGVLVGALNRFLTNGTPVSNLDLFISAVTTGHFDDSYAPLRAATTNLFNTGPQGTNLVQLKRMLLDDLFRGAFFTRGGNWGTRLTGFRIHYHTLQYANGHKLVQHAQKDVVLSALKYRLGANVYPPTDDEGVLSGAYKYTWTIPQGALCWASVGAMVDGQESEVSIEAGPQRAPNNDAWDAALRAIPGNHQVYLDWADDVNCSGYNVSYSTETNAINDNYTNWTSIVVNAPMNRCWHTGLTNGTYYYQLMANFYDGSSATAYVSATVTNCPALSQTNFAAYASAYDRMVLVEWTVPKTNLTDTNIISQTNWQFFVERKLVTDNNAAYQAITDIGFGLAYLDADVANGQAYNYRVTAFDQVFNRLQAVAVAKGGVATNICPSATNTLTLLPPTPGCGFVDLAWSPIRANQFTIKHALNPGGPFEAVESLNVNDAYQNAKNTYRHTGLQNGVMHYYQITATTPTGFTLDSGVQGAMPLATLTPLPPGNFKGVVVPEDATANHIMLTWRATGGAATYQVFWHDQSSYVPLFNGPGTASVFAVPADATDGQPFTFAARSVNAAGLISDLVETTVTNQLPDSSTVAAGDSAVVLTVSGSRTNVLWVVGPTNLTLSAEVNVPEVAHVDFYADDMLIGSADNPPYQMTWCHVPGTTPYSPHVVKAVAVSGASYNSSGRAFPSSTIQVNVQVEPQLSAYQTSATDLQLPAPALPISVSRSYTSRSTETNGILGVGWTAGWNLGSIKLSAELGSGWQGVKQSAISGTQYYISEMESHYVTVTLPGGQSVGFAPTLNYYPQNVPEYYDDSILGILVGIKYESFSTGQGSLASDSMNDLTLDCSYDSALWQGDPITIITSPAQFTYTAPEGTVYTYGQPSLNDNLTWLISQVTDRNGNTLNYLYDTNNNLTAISNSCGRQVTFGYTPTTYGSYTGTNISVTNMAGGAPVVVYVVSNNLLTEVRQLIARTNVTAGLYQTNRYTYGTTGADANRLTDVFDARGVRVLHNTYTTNSAGDFTGDVRMQVSPGRTNTFQVDASYNLTVTTTSSTATNTAKVTSDASGAISGATVPVSGTNASGSLATQCSYDGQGNLVSQTDANNQTKNYTYDDQNRLVGQWDENGYSTGVQLGDDGPPNYGQPTVSTDANGKQTLYEYDNSGNPASVRDPAGTVTTYTYTNVAAGGAVRASGLLASERQIAPPYPIVTTNSYDASGNLIQTVQQWEYANTNDVNRVIITNSYTYDANGNRLTETKQRTVTNGVELIVTTNLYDAQNRVVTNSVSASVNGVTTLPPQISTVTYNALGKQATSTDAAGRTTTNTYDYNGNLIETAYPDGTVSRTAYDGFGRQWYAQERAVASGNDTTAPATRNTYDASGRVVKVEKFASVTLTKTTATNHVDFEAAVSGFEPQFKMVAADPGTNTLTTTRTFYDLVGRVQYAVDARGAVTQYLYDAAGRRTNVLVYAQALSLTDVPSTINYPLSTAVSSTAYTYDANGNQTTVTDAAGQVTTSHYDDANRVKEVDFLTNGVPVSRFTYYDGLGRKTQETDEAGVSTGYTYDFRGLLTSVTLAFGTTQAVTTVYDYDELGNMVKQTDAAGHSTTNRYDALGRRTARFLPGGQSEGYCYQPATGNLLYQTNFNGVVITNGYDFASGRLTNVSSVSYQTTYAYSPLGLRTNMVDASGTNSYIYNPLGQLTNKTVAWKGGLTVALNYGYSPLGTLTNLWSSTANGVSNVYQSDVLGRMTNVLANGSAAASYGFDVVGNLQTLRYGNGVTNLYQYDARNRLTNLVWKAGGSTLASFGYTVGATGNRTASAETVNGTSRTYTWNYDYLYRLTSEGIGNIGTVNYGFDAVGNRTNRTSNVSGIANQAPTYTPNDWLASDTYDNNGNTTASTGNTTYQYDVMNHLTNAAIGATTIQIVYDGDGNRVSKKVGTTTTYYLVDDRNPSGYAQVLEEYQGSSLSRVYNYGLALISQRVPSTSTNYFICDGHGSTRMLANAGGGVVNAFTYDAYGTLIASNGTPQTAYLYCGEQFDFDLGLSYNRARYLNLNTGRFFNRDSFEGNSEDPLSLHHYLYCQANPANMTDPSGHDPEMPSLVTTMGQMGAFAGRSYAAVNRAYWMSLVRLTPVIERGWEAIFWADVALTTASVVPEVLNCAADLGGRINRAFSLNNTTIPSAPGGQGGYGIAIENIGGQQIEEMGGKYLGGNVKGIDGTLGVAPGNVLVSIKAHDLADDNLLGAIKRDMNKLATLDPESIKGTTVGGKPFQFEGAASGRIVVVGVPQTQMRYVISPQFINGLRALAEETQTIPVIRAVRNWTGRPR